MDLGDNRLASIHGFEQCKSLLELNLAENRIARIGEMVLGFPRRLDSFSNHFQEDYISF